MPRSTIKLQFIEDKEARNAAMRKGKKSLIKKMSELTKSGDVDACFVMYDNEGGPPTVWPSTAEARRLLEKYEESKRRSAKQNLAAFLKKRIAEKKEELKIEKEKYIRNLMVSCLLGVNAVSEIRCNETLRELCAMTARVKKVIDALMKEKEASGSKPEGV